jgi:hypothetical protein
MWKKTPDGSFFDANGRVVFFGSSRFERDICLGECCAASFAETLNAVPEF